MFGDLLGNMEDKQKEMREKLAQIVVEAEAGGGAIKITANAAREITNISIDKNALNLEDVEQLEDLLLVAVNRVMENISAKEQEESKNLSGLKVPLMSLPALLLLIGTVIQLAGLLFAKAESWQRPFWLLTLVLVGWQLWHDSLLPSMVPL